MEKYLQERAELFEKLWRKGVRLEGNNGKEFLYSHEIGLVQIQAFHTETTAHLIEMMREIVGEYEEIEIQSGDYTEHRSFAKMLERQRILSQLPNQKQS